MVKNMRYFFDNEGIFLRAVARKRDGGGVREWLFYGLSPAIRDGRGCEGVAFLRAVARNTGRRG